MPQVVPPVAAILRLPTPEITPTPGPSGVTGCAAWVYLLHWDRPSRLASLKNALGDTVSLNSEYYPPGTNITDSTTTPWIVERTPDGRFNKPNLPDGSASPYNGAAAGGAADGSAWPAISNPNWSVAGASVTYRQGTALEAYYASLPPLPPPLPFYTPTPTPPAAVPTPATGVDLWADPSIPNPLYDYPWGGNVVGNYHVTAYDQFGDQATWAWTLTYGMSGPDIIYGPDPGPPFVAYDETVLSGLTTPSPATQPFLPNPQPTPRPYPDYPERAPGSWGSFPNGSSIPGVTGVPTVGFVRVDPPKKIVSSTSDKVNWGLFSFQDRTPWSPDVGTYCQDPSDIGKNYELIQNVDPSDNAKIVQIEPALNLVFYGGMTSAGGTPSKEGLRRAGVAFHDNTYLTDPKVPLHCDRPYGLIFCTDGLSNICNPGGDPADYTGPPASGPILPSNWNGASGGEPWTSPCEGYYGYDTGCYTAAVPPSGGAARLWNCCDPGSKRNGSGFDCNASTMSADSTIIDTYKTAAPVPWAGTPDGFVAGIAETLFSTGFQLVGDAKSKAHVRTFVIGISPTVGKCELNYTAYRGRSDASAPKGDAGYTYQIIPGLDPGDPRLPQDQNGEDGTTPNTYAANIGSGDYAFFASDSQSIYDAFQEIIAGTATGDYATSPPIAGAAIRQGNMVLLPSTNYPTWEGHFRAIDTLKPLTDPPRWDAGEVLSIPSTPGYITPAQRKIYTWDPTDLSSGLVEVLSDAGSTTNLARIAGLPGPSLATFTRNVADFIRGNDGTLSDTARKWLLGATINSTPAVVGSPEVYKGTFAGTHASFEIKYKDRNPVAWLGSDDGMIHAFDFNTGRELLALLPPELLARQVTLYTNYKTLLRPSGAHKTETGQAPDIAQHIWGVAQSFRYADVYDTANSVWKTVGYLTLGPAGDSVTAVDVTHPSLGDPDFDATKPVEILWRKSSADLPGLGPTWSVPAVAAAQATPEKFLMLMGAGFNAASKASNQLDTKLFQLQALDGADGYTTGNRNWVPIQAAAVDPLNKPLVGEQAFAASVFFDTTKPTYFGNNIANLGLQADLNGQIWFNYATGGTTDFDLVKLGFDVPGAINTIEGASDQAPLYYPPAASGKGTSGCQVYAFGSGTAYEKSLLVTETSGNAAPAGEQTAYAWSPRLFVAVNDRKNAPFSPAGGPIDASGGRILAQKVTDVELPCCPTDPTCDPTTLPNPRCFLKVGDPTTLGPRTQLTAPPFLLVPLSGTGKFAALFLVYDPDAIGFCRGFSYVIGVTFQIDSSCGGITIDSVASAPGGEGAASGFAMAGSQIVLGKSGVGAGQKAGIVQTKFQISAWGTGGNLTPVYWKELQ